jgi:predicted O-methyltransferase YrrM
MVFLSLYAKGIHALRSVLKRAGILERIDKWAKKSRWGLWFRSLFSVLDFEDFQSLDTPWWVMTAGAEIDEFLRQRPHSRVLEWGSGASTVWLSRRSSEVFTLESDPDWAARVRALIPATVQLILREAPRRTLPHSLRSRRLGFRSCDFRDYVEAAQAIPGAFDLIVVDGRAREACFRHAHTRLTEGGVILFDNTNRRRYRAELRRHRGHISVQTHVGLTPILPWPSHTSIVRVLPHHAASG